MKIGLIEVLFKSRPYVAVSWSGSMRQIWLNGDWGKRVLAEQVRGVYLDWATVPVRCQVRGDIGRVCLPSGLNLPCSSSVWNCRLLGSRRGSDRDVKESEVGKGSAMGEGRRSEGDGIIALEKWHLVCGARYHATAAWEMKKTKQ